VAVAEDGGTELDFKEISEQEALTALKVTTAVLAPATRACRSACPLL
jgi:hypothetical protein